MFKIKDLMKTGNLAVIAMLIAANVVLSRFLSFNVWNLKIGFTFVTVVFAAYLFGPIAAALVGGLGGLIGALPFSIGPYFPGFTLTAVLTGICFGVFLYKKTSFAKICSCVAINELIGSALLNTLWIAVLYGSDFKAVLMSRLPTQILPMMVVEIVFIQLVFGKSMAADRIAAAIKSR